MKPSGRFMTRAIKAAAAGMRRKDGGPFGAVIVKGGRVVAAANNTVLGCRDATCHAEMNAIRTACRKLRHFKLGGCVIYSTTEPCPMCFAAIHWAGIDGVVYGTRIADAAKRGFRELHVSNRTLKRLGLSPVFLRAGFMRKECLKLLKQWDGLDKKQVY